jgi:hypothetical protein
MVWHGCPMALAMVGRFCYTLRALRGPGSKPLAVTPDEGRYPRG